MMGAPGEQGSSPSFSPQAMMMMMRQPSNNKGYQGDDANAYNKDQLLEVIKTVDSESLTYYTTFEVVLPMLQTTN